MIRTITLLVLLSACAPTGNTPDAICDRESFDDPTVKLIMNRQEGNSWLAFNDPDAVKNARSRAKRACLARLGQIPATGGVEPMRQPDNSFRGLF